MPDNLSAKKASLLEAGASKVLESWAIGRGWLGVGRGVASENDGRWSESLSVSAEGEDGLLSCLRPPPEGCACRI